MRLLVGLAVTTSLVLGPAYAASARQADTGAVVVTLKGAKATVCAKPLPPGGSEPFIRVDGRKAKVPVRGIYNLVGTSTPSFPLKTAYVKGKRTAKISTGGVDSNGVLVYSVKVVLATAGGAKKSGTIPILGLPAC